MPTNKKTNAKESLEKHLNRKLTLGLFLHSIRKADDLSQVAFAEILGISKQHLCDIEHERRFVSPKMAQEFAKKIGYSEEQFIRLSLQDSLRRDNIDFIVDLKVA